jgi:hypothetical protein
MIVDCHKCPLAGCCIKADGHFQYVNNCPLAHTVYTQVKDWIKPSGLGEVDRINEIKVIESITYAEADELLGIED